MKLTDKLIPHQSKIDENRIYSHFKEIFNDALSDSPKPKDENEILSIDSYTYELTDEEMNFFENIYVQYGNSTNIKSDYITDFFGEDVYIKNKIGEDEKKLLDFILQDNNSNVLLITAPVGRGKSTLVFHTFFYLLQKSIQIKQKYIPVYLSSDEIKNELAGMKKAKEIRDSLFNHLINKNLIDISKNFTKLSNDNFWNALSKNSEEFRFLEIEKEDISEIYKDNLDKKNIKIKQSRRKAREKENFLLHAIKTIQKVYSKKTILIFDDFDPLDLFIQETILNEAFYLSNNYNLKIVINMRDNTFKKLDHNVDGILSERQLDRLSLNTINLENYLKNRIKSAYDSYKKRIPKFNFEFIDTKINTRVTQENGWKLISNMLDYLMYSESNQLLGHISYQNLKRINDFLKLYLSTGIVTNTKFYENIIKMNFEEMPEDRNQLWILLSSIITANYGTHFSTDGKCPEPKTLRFIINLFCNSRDGVNKYSENKYLIRFHLLSNIYKSTEVSRKDLYTKYKMVLNPKDESIYEKSFNRALYRMLEANLIVSPQSYVINKVSSVSDLHILQITDTGRFYLETFCSYFEYIMFMKDDIDFPDDLSFEKQYQICNCVDESSFKEQYEKSVLGFIRFFETHEINFYRNLNKNQRKIFREKFSYPISNEKFISAFLINKLIDYGKRKDFNIENYLSLQSELTNSLKEIN